MKNPLLKLSLAIVLALASIQTFAQQSAVIKGTVKTSDGKPAAAVSVGLNGTAKGTITNEDGNYQLSKIKPGSYTVKVTAVGLAPQEQSVALRAGQTLTVDFMLREDARQLQEVVVKSGNLKFGSKKSESVARMPLENLENPQVYSVITNSLLKEQIIADYKTALRNASGTVTLAQAGNGRSYTFMRGFITSNFIRNGLGANQYSAIDPANIDRIEVIKGPSGTLFGTGLISYGGLVNRITKKPLDTARTELSYTAGSFGLNRVTADVNTPLNDSKTVLFRLNAAYHNQGSFQDAGFERNFLIAPTLTYKASDRLTFNVDLELYQRHTTSISGYNFFDLSAFAGKSFKDLPIDYNRSYSGNDVDTRLTNYNIYLQAGYKISDHWKSQTLFTLNGVYAPNQLFANKFVLSTTTMQRNLGKLSDKYHQTEVQQNFNGDVKIGSIRNRILLGLDWTAYRQAPYYFITTKYDQINYTQPGNFFIDRTAINKTLDTLSKSPADQNTYNSAAYFADVISLTDRLNAMVSLRIDHYQDKGAHDINSNTYSGAFSQTKASPKFGLIYQLVKNQVSLFGNYMNGFNYTNAKDENGKLFKPEQAYQYEGGVKLETFGNKLSATLSYYNILVNDIIRTNPANSNFSIQDGTQSSKGLEAEVVANPVTGLNILLGYAFNKSIFTKSDSSVQGKRPYGTPANVINGWISYVISSGKLKGAGIGVGGNYASQTFYDDTNFLTLPSYVVLSSTIFYDRPSYRVGFKVDNITSKHYWAPFGQAQQPRSFTANVSYKF